MFTRLSAFPLTPIPGNGNVDEKAFAVLVQRLAAASPDDPESPPPTRVPRRPAQPSD
ncbi:hypothetical protein [Streptomyces sp. NRRL S-448]|uniref:hypothetical protein n=1 Tax=Streptomyces sp. NRRL S-448 TaxID=1463907 RepID=UPI000B03E6AD